MITIHAASGKDLKYKYAPEKKVKDLKLEVAPLLQVSALELDLIMNISVLQNDLTLAAAGVLAESMLTVIIAPLPTGVFKFDTLDRNTLDDHMSPYISLWCKANTDADVTASFKADGSVDIFVREVEIPDHDPDYDVCRDGAAWEAVYNCKVANRNADIIALDVVHTLRRGSFEPVDQAGGIPATLNCRLCENRSEIQLEAVFAAEVCKFPYSRCAKGLVWVTLQFRESIQDWSVANSVSTSNMVGIPGQTR